MTNVNTQWLEPPKRLTIESSDTIHIWKIDLDSSPGKNFLSPKEQEQAAKFATAELERRYTNAHNALRLILSYYTNCSPTQFEFTYGEFDKPALKRPYGSISYEFNMSHSQRIGLIAIGRDRSLGVDVECLSRRNEDNMIARRNFTATEYAEYAEASDQLKHATFLSLWTRKEAVLKACGGGLSGKPKLQEFSVSGHPSEQQCRIEFQSTKLNQIPWSLHSFQPDPGTIAAIAAQHEVTCLKFWQYKH